MNRVTSVFGLAAALITGASLQAGTISVNSTADVAGDDGVCTLREAIIAANSNFASGSSSGECAAGAAEPTVDQIVFEPAVSGAIMLSGTLGSISESVEILGPGAEVLALDASGFPSGQRILSVLDASVIEGLNFRNAATDDSGALVISAPTTVRDCAFEDNAAAEGGAILSQEDLTVERSRFTRNVATDFSGGAIRIGNANRLLIIRDSLFEMNEVRGAFRSGGAVEVSGTGHLTEISGSTFTANLVTGGGDGGAISIGGDALSVVNSTFSGNEADRSAGAIEAQALDNVLHSVTITGNRADADGDGSGDAALDQAAGTPVSVRTSIIAGNIDEGGEAPDCSGTFTTGGFNLIGAAGLCSGFTNGASGDQVGSMANPLDAGLEPLAENGGPTPTHALAFDSPAIEGGDPAGCTAPDGSPLLADQRNELRPAPGGSVCDIGAFELAAVPTRTLDVSVAGSGSVQGSPAGINCPGDCSEDYAEGTVVTLSQTADPGFAFDGWSGDCSGTGACQVTMDQARSVTATFSEIVHPLTVQVTVGGQVTSSPAGINCPGDCSEDYAEGTVVTLSPTVDPGFAFDGWSGDCSGTGACQVTMDQARSVSAAFVAASATYEVNVEIIGNGVGMVTSLPTGINCPGSCIDTFADGTTVTLSPIAGGTSEFLGWSADCGFAGTAACQVTVDQPYRAIAIFGDGDLMFLDGFE